MSKIVKTFLKFLSIIITVLYPFFIYYLLSTKSSFHVISLILLLVVVINFLKIKSIIILFIGLILTLFLSFTNNEIFLKIYPVCMNLIVSLAFLGSLLKTPLITLFAQKLKYEITDDDLSYTRKATIAWGVFMFLIMILSLITVFMSDFTWALFNGLIAYMLNGLMIIIEYIERTRIRKNH